MVQPKTSSSINFETPPGACDCHTPVFGDPGGFPLFPGRTFTPAIALPEEFGAFHGALGIQRVVIVTPSVYGTDNSATLYGMKARGTDARGVAVIEEKRSLNTLAINDIHLLNLLPVCAPDSSLRKKILVDNPAALYRF